MKLHPLSTQRGDRRRPLMVALRCLVCAALTTVVATGCRMLPPGEGRRGARQSVDLQRTLAARGSDESRWSTRQVVDVSSWRVAESDSSAGSPGDKLRRVDAGAGPDAGVSLEPQWILSDAIDNARDLGGTPLGPDARAVYGQLFRGPPLAALSEDACSQWGELGVRTVIDLRVDYEREDAPEADCVTGSARIVTAPLPVPYQVSPENYIADLNSSESIASVFQQLGDDSAYPIYFHCTWGRDRTGVVAAVILSALGASQDTIIREYLLSSRTVGAYPISLKAALDSIELRGGIRAYLREAGVSDAQIDVLRQRAIEPR